MSRTFGHNKASRKGFAAYRTAKPWRTSYNRSLRSANASVARTLTIDPSNDNVIFFRREEVRNGSLYDHPGD